MQAPRMRIARRFPDDDPDERDATRVPDELARLKRRRAAAGNRRVEQEDGKDSRHRERDDEPRRAASTSHAGIVVPRLQTGTSKRVGRDGAFSESS